MKKIYDLCVKVRQYTDKEGKTKNAYVNIGAIMEKDDGGRMMFLNRHFNPAGVAFKDGSESILVSMFDQKNQDAPSAPDDDIGF